MPTIPTFLTTLLLCARLAATAQDESVIRINGNIRRRYERTYPAGNDQRHRQRHHDHQ
jgi:hypothetical protein